MNIRGKWTIHWLASRDASRLLGALFEVRFIMQKFIAFLLGLSAINGAVAECIATGYRKSDPIPTYVVLGHKSLQDDWGRYVAQYAESARLIDSSGADLAVESLLER